MKSPEESPLKQLNDLIKKVNKHLEESKKDETIQFWLEMQPYMSALGIPMPKDPLKKLDFSPLIKAIFSSQISFSSSSITENLVSILQKNAFSLHQMLGVIEKYKKISPEECKFLRKNIAEHSCDLIIILNKKVKIDRKKEDVRFDLREREFDIQKSLTY
jgi:hypothetical protein